MRHLQGKKRKWLFIIGFSLLLCGFIRANEPSIFPERISTPIEIDGVLNESVWQRPGREEAFITTSPTYGQQMTQKTLIWTAYDRKNLYFAFKCLDSEPGKIKTSISRRDNITRDDFVGIFLDAAGARQTAYEFYVNPNGIQSDSVHSTVSVDGADKSPDFVWESAAKITGDGYHVEIRIPLDSIRYQTGKQTKMGILFFRQISRLGEFGRWPQTEPGQPYFNFTAPLIYKNMKSGLKLEILPNFTYSRNEERTSPDDWTPDTETNVGVGIKYGITSSITAEATVNPDFSQVESDAFQVEVNQRYPLFYSEKRPFFMESKEVLDFSVVKWGLMPAPVHTRRIVDPGWALKLSGSAGKMSFALLAANDRVPGQDSALVGIFRAKYNIGSDNSVGILYSGRHLGDMRNDAAGADLKYRLSKHMRASLSFLSSHTRDSENAPTRKGNAWNAMFQYNTPRFFSMIGYEWYDPDFNMETGFINRVGVSQWTIGAGPTIDTKIKPLPWLKRITPYAYYLRLYDIETQLDDDTGLLGITVGLSKLGTFNFEYYFGEESWAGQSFRKNFFLGLGSVQLFKWLHLSGNFTLGDSIYYDPVSPFGGDGRTFGFGVTVEPGVRVNLGLDYRYTDLKTKQEKDTVYSVNIYNFRATYQFNKYFFVRGILRYDDYQEKLLTDFLASFTLIPGTVVHLGYGSLHLKNRWQTDHWVPGQGDLMQMKRGLFFKASYLWRLD